MIKRYLLGIGISILSLFGFSSAYFEPTQVISLPGSILGSDGVTNYIDKNLNFNYNGQKIIRISDYGNEYNIFWNNGRLYLYAYYTYFNDYGQGYFQKFCRVRGTGYCCDGTVDVGNEFYDLYNYDYNFSQILLSIQSETDDPGICFYDQLNNTTYCTAPVSCSNNSNMLSGSLQIQDGATSFGYYAQDSPFYNGGNISNSSGIGENVQLTGNILYKPCTWGNAMKYFEVMGYNSNICYGGLNTFDVLTGGYISVPRSGKNVFEIYQQLAGYGQSEEDFFNEWLNIYNNAYDGNYYDQVLNGQPTVLRTFFDFYRQYGVFDVSSMLFYCEAYLRDDPDRPIISSEFPDSFKGDFNYICSSSVDETLGIEFGSGLAQSLGLDWSGIIRSGDNDVYDGVTFISTFFNKLKSYYSIPNQYGGKGIIPSYIVTFLLAVMLFKFLRK